MSGKSKKSPDPTPKRRVGRPSKYTPPGEKWQLLPEDTALSQEISDVILEEIAKGVPKEDAALRAGICLKTMYNWEVHPEFLQGLRKAQAIRRGDSYIAIADGAENWAARCRLEEIIETGSFRRVQEVKLPGLHTAFEKGLDDWLQQHPQEPPSRARNTTSSPRASKAN